MSYISTTKINIVRALLAARNWQDSNQVSYVERAAVLQLVIDWAQGRVEAPDQIAAVIDDSHIGSGNSGYGLGQRIDLIAAHLASKIDRTHSDHGTRMEVLYAPVTADGLDRFTAWLEAQPERDEPWSMGEVDTTLDMHPNQRRALKDVAAADRSAVVAHAHFLTNVSGGTQSSNIYLAVQDLKRLGSAEALREDDRKANEALMARSSLYR